MPIDKNRAAAVIEFVGEDKVRQLAAAINADIDGMGKRTRRVTEENEKQIAVIERVRGSWQSTITALDSVASIAGRVAGLVRDIGAAMKDAAQEQAIAASFDRAFAGAERFGEALERATGGQLDDEVYQRIAVQLHEAGIEGEQIERVLNLATKAANATGREVAQVADSFADAITRGNDRALRAVGINVDLKNVLREHARETGRTVTEIGLAETRTLLLKAAAEGVGKAFGDVNINDTALARVNQLQVRWNGFVDDVKAGTLALADSGFWADAKSNALDLVDIFGPLVGFYSRPGATNRQEAAGRTGESWLARQFDEHLATIETVKRATEAATQAQRDAERADRDRAAGVEEHSRALFDAVRATAEAAQAERLRNAELMIAAQTLGDWSTAQSYAEKLTRSATSATSAATKSLSEQLALMREQKAVAIANAQALGTLALAQSILSGDRTMGQLAAEQLGQVTSLAGVKGGGGGGGGGKTKAKPGTDGDRSRAAAIAEAQQAADSLAKWQEDQDWEKEIEGYRAVTRAVEEQSNAFEAARASALSYAKDGLGGAAEALRSSGSEIADAVSSLSDSLATHAESVGGVLQKIFDGGPIELSAKGVAGAAPAFAGAIGKMVGALAKNKAWEFGFMGAGEVAAGIRDLATPGMQGSAVLHFAAAAQYGVAAALAGASGSGGGGGGGSAGGGARKSPSVPSAFGPPEAQQAAPVTINVVLSGANLFADDPAVYRKLGQGLAREARYGVPQGYAP